MIDREKVIEGLETIREFFGFGLPSQTPVFEAYQNILMDVLTLLKKQEAREPYYTTLRYLVDGMEVAIQHPECPRCIENGLALWDAEIEKGQAYCKRCGQEVKWND